MYIVQDYIVHSRMYKVQCTLYMYNVRSVRNVYRAHVHYMICPLLTVYCKLYNIHCILYNIHCIV